MKDFMLNIIDFLYKRIFKEKMGKEARDFLKNLSYLAIGSGIATIFIFIFNVAAGRMLGASEYGRFALVQSIAMILSIPMLSSIITGMVRYNAAEKLYKERSAILSTTYILILLFSIPSVMIFIIFSWQLSQIFFVSREIFLLSIFLGLFFVLYNLTTGTIQSLHEIKKLAVLRVIYSLILLSVFIFFIYLDLISFKSAVVSTYLAYLISGVIIVFCIRKYLSIKSFNILWISRLLKYGIFGTLGMISMIISTNIDKILINKYLMAKDVGLYSAYYFASIGIISVVITIFITVFFPMASKYKSKEIIYERIVRISPYLLIFCVPIILCLEFLILTLYGEDYPINLNFMLLFAFTAVVFLLYQIFSWFLSSFGTHGVKIVGCTTFFMAFVNIILNLLLIPLMGISGAIFTTFVTYLCSLIFFIYKLERGVKVG